MKSNNYLLSTFISISLHAVLIVVLIFGADWTAFESKPQLQGHFIQAIAVDPNLIKEQARKIKARKILAEKNRQAHLKKLAQQAQLLADQKRDAKLELLRLKKEKLIAEKKAIVAKKLQLKREQEQKIAAKKARIAKANALAAAAEIKAQLAVKKKAEIAAKKALTEKMQQEEATRKAQLAAKKAKALAIAEKEKTKKIKQERKQQEQMLNSMFEDLSSENNLRTTARSKILADELQRNASIFQSMIQQNLKLDNQMLGQTCQIQLNLASNGFVIQVSDGRGDKRLCRAARAAVLQIGQFPMPKDKALIEELKRISLKVAPK